MHKQVTTAFTYTVIDEHGNRRQQTGSYIGRKVATIKTLRRFVNAAIRKYIPASRLGELSR